MDDDETIRVLQRNGLVQQREGESWEAFAERIWQDVKHRDGRLTASSRAEADRSEMPT